MIQGNKMELIQYLNNSETDLENILYLYTIDKISTPGSSLCPTTLKEFEQII